MKAVEVELNQEKSITEEMKRKVEAEKRKRGREEDDKEEEEEVKKKEKVEEEDPFDKIRATASENKLKSPQLSVSVPNGLKVNSKFKLILIVDYFHIVFHIVNYFHIVSGQIDRGPRFFRYPGYNLESLKCESTHILLFTYL